MFKAKIQQQVTSTSQPSARGDVAAFFLSLHLQRPLALLVAIRNRACCRCSDCFLIVTRCYSCKVQAYKTSTNCRTKSVLDSTECRSLIALTLLNEVASMFWLSRCSTDQPHTFWLLTYGLQLFEAQLTFQCGTFAHGYKIVHFWFN